MKIYDISQEVFDCSVYPGDPKPKKGTLRSIGRGDLYNLSKLSMCVHNGTHIDAPYHFLQEGKSVEKIALEKVIGYAFVATHNGDLLSDDALRILEKAKQQSPESAKRILIKGNAIVTLSAAKIFAENHIELIGVESQSVGPEDAPMAVHIALLEKDIVLLEGLSLLDIPEGVYFLCAAPLALADADGAPCRAVLIQYDENDYK